MDVVMFDTNCLIDLASTGPRAADLTRVLAAGRTRPFEIGVGAISASENPRRGCISTFEQFKDLLARVGLAEAQVLRPMGYWGVTFWGEALWTNDEMADLERQVHAILAPSLAMDDMSNKRKWLNTKCDVQMVWTHLWHKTDALITSDEGIVTKAPALANLGANVHSPSGFAARL